MTQQTRKTNKESFTTVARKSWQSAMRRRHSQIKYPTTQFLISYKMSTEKKTKYNIVHRKNTTEENT
jgi:hypothetical protein